MAAPASNGIPRRVERATRSRVDLRAIDVPNVLIVIPTLNEAAHILELLESLVRDPPPSAHLVVADGGSTDGTREIARDFAAKHANVHFVHNPRRVQSAAINRAVQRLGREADVLIRCDAHAAYPERYCQRLVAALVERDADAVVVPLDSLGHTPLQRVIAWVSNSRLGTGGSAHRAGRRSGFVDHGHHAAFRMDMFRIAGGYDETFSHNEDAEFDCRQRALGARVYLDATIRVGYFPRETLTGLWNQYFLYGAGRSRTARRHPRSLKPRQLAVVGHLVSSLLAVAVSPWFAWPLLGPALYLAVLGAASLGCALHQRSGSGLLAGPVAAVLHTAWACGFLAGLARRKELTWNPQMAVPLRLATTSEEPG